MLALSIAVASGLVWALFYFKPPQITPVSKRTLRNLEPPAEPLDLE